MISFRTDCRKDGGIFSAMARQRKSAVIGLAGALSKQAPKIKKALEERLADVLEPGEVMPDVGQLFVLMSRLVRRAGGEMETFDATRTDTRMKGNVLRREIRKEKAKLYTAMVKVRKTMVDLYGAKYCRVRFNLEPRTPRGTDLLVCEARTVIFHLMDSEQRPLPEPRLPLASEPEVWIAALRPSLEKLETLTFRRDMRTSTKDSSVIERQQALAASDETYLLVARVAESLLRLAGRKEQAHYLRPKTRRLERQPYPVETATAEGPVQRGVAAFFERWGAGTELSTEDGEAAQGTAAQSGRIRLDRRLSRWLSQRRAA